MLLMPLVVLAGLNVRLIREAQARRAAQAPTAN